MLAAVLVSNNNCLIATSNATDVAAALPANAAMARAQMAKRFLHEDAERFSNRYDGGTARDACWVALASYSPPCHAGFAPR